MLRGDIKCFGKEDCYSLTFGIPMMIMIISSILFLIGSKQYIKLPPNGNMLVKVVKCVKHALSTKSKSLPEADQKSHWLEHAEEKYGKKLVMETKMALKVVLMSLPVPIFWACLMQQRSRWIFQAVKMNGDIGFYKIKPDQMIVFNSFLSITMIPILDKFVYPLLEKVGIKSMLQRLIFGGILIVVAFVLSVIVETQIQQNYISILWQIPQFFIISIAEIFTYLSHLNFAYKEAPASMKPVMMSLLYLSMAGGDLIVAIISGISIFSSQVYEFSFFAGLMLFNVVILAYLAKSYESVDDKIIKETPNDEKV
jgi:dipeptide/tripeptide permease